MLKKIDFKMLTGAITSFSISSLTVMGITQNFIPFSGPINEMSFALLATGMGCLFSLMIKK